MNRKKAIYYLLAASVLWSMGGLLIKLIDLNPMAIAGTRSGIAALLMMFYLKIPKIKLKRNKVLGACSYATLVILFVAANKLTTSANAILLQFTAPIWVALFGSWFLKEKVRPSDWTTIGVVMLGMTLFFVGDLQVGHMFGNILAIISGLVMAAMVIFLKLEDDGSPVEISYLGNILTFIVCIPFLFMAVPTLQDLLFLGILGVFQLGLSYILYTTAVQHVSAIEAILITVIEPILNPVWVFWRTGEYPGVYAFFGGVIVLTAVILRSIYQARKEEITLEKTTLQG